MPMWATGAYGERNTERGQKLPITTILYDLDSTLAGIDVVEVSQTPRAAPVA
jgi:hypothetical protein